MDCCGGQSGEAADQLRELVGSIRLLHLGRQGFLPSEAEWEYAAAGGSEQREYAWGSTAPGAGNQYAIYSCDYPSGIESCSGVANIAPVGTATLGAGAWGQLDMGGEVEEWNLDGFANYVDPCIDCAHLSPNYAGASGPAWRVLRGGSFNLGTSDLLPPSRDYVIPAIRWVNIGFRCARSTP
jgi:sulfatase modifying factor 1